MFSGCGLIKISGAYFNEHLKSLITFLDNNKNQNLVLMVGGGNIVRGRSFTNSKRLLKDRMGILSTLINAIDLADKLSELNIESYITSPICNEDVINQYNPIAIKRIINQNKIQVIVCGGLGWCGNVSTDTAMVIRGLELSCNWVCKASTVGGVFDDDPQHNSSAKLLNQLTYDDALQYNAYDKSAVLIAKENSLPLVVSSLSELTKALSNQDGNFTIVN